MREARAQIEEFVSVLSTEAVPVERARGRILADDAVSPSAVPAYDESLRDGYVLAEFTNPCDIKSYQLTPFEVAAGTEEIPRLAPGQGCRIFTGGVIPEGGTRVYPHEVCQVESGLVSVKGDTNAPARRHIREKGSEIHSGECLVAKGSIICGDHIATLAAVGIAEVTVQRQVRTGYFCTGSELVQAGTKLRKGQKNSINGLVLGDRLPGFGGVVTQRGVLSDDEASLLEMFAEVGSHELDLVVTTGGMGPGKYDLVRSSFLQSGGKILFDSLPMRPGKSILVGSLGKTVFIALPGPPNAVKTLINELVGPVMLLMQGAEKSWPEAVEAELLHDLTLRKRDLLQFKSGVLVYKAGKLYVRLAKRLEPGTCFLTLWPDGDQRAKGELVEVHFSR